MEGAASVFSADPTKAITTALLVGFDAVVKMNACLILSEQSQTEDADLIVGFLHKLCQTQGLHLGSVLLASWRAALKLVESGLDVTESRRTLEWLFP